MKYLKYLTVKNAIIAILVTVIYLSWLIKGLSIVKIVFACMAIFVAMLALLMLADKCYMKAIKKSASDGNP